MTIIFNFLVTLKTGLIIDFSGKNQGTVNIYNSDLLIAKSKAKFDLKSLEKDYKEEKNVLIL